ncbi:DUF998 domain-containing protein [Marmoricola endophyticus]|uniref:DUF998 domain-containing protein n=1 Tax=Marmoricola endophyticus TaxID=2040280 RepID=UPI0016657238|nr:DUF998 domain-containing protein [Marmoricola endophyticus]
MHRSVLVSSVVAPVALIGGWTLAATRQPASYDPVSQTISALAGHDATDRWVMTTGIAVTGVAHVVTALGLTEARPASRVLLAAGGVATTSVAVFAEPSQAHVPVATTSFVLLAAWPLLSDVPSRRAGLVAGIGLGALAAWLGTELGGPRVGGVERVVAGAQSLWPLAAVALVRRTTSRAARA